MMNDIVLDVVITTTLVLVATLEAVLHSKVGRGVLSVLVVPWLEPLLVVLYYSLKYGFGPFLEHVVSPSIRNEVRVFLVHLSSLPLLRHPYVLKPLYEITTIVTVEIVDLMYGHEARLEVEEFLRLGIGTNIGRCSMDGSIYATMNLSSPYRTTTNHSSATYPDGNRHHRFVIAAIKKGSGRVHDVRNVYFPLALTQGLGNESIRFGRADEPTIALQQIQIAQSCLYMSIMSYRSDTVIRNCIAGGMFPIPNPPVHSPTDSPLSSTSHSSHRPSTRPSSRTFVKHYSVHTESADKTDINLFVAPQQWMVLVFRGTELETLRNYWTCALAEDAMPFGKFASPRNSANHDNQRTVRRHYYQSMRSACGENPCRRYTVEPPIQIPGQLLDATVFDLIRYTAKYEPQTKLYVCGHSLGGGLATLFSAHVKEYYNVNVTATITFGAPPVAGNAQFVQWFHQNVASMSPSWQFVNGNEFAALSPPLPWPSSLLRFYHVDQLIDAQSINRTTALSRVSSARSLSSYTTTPTHMMTPKPRNGLDDTSSPMSGYDDAMERLEQMVKDRKMISLLYDHNPLLIMRQLQLASARTRQAVQQQQGHSRSSLLSNSNSNSNNNNHRNKTLSVTTPSSTANDPFLT